jgi:hypothetical protein
MSAPTLTRRSYEAEVLLVPLDNRARSALNGLAAEALAEITVTPPELPRTLDGRLEEAARRADIVIMLSYDLGAVDPAVVARLDKAAHGTGAPLGTVIIAPDCRWTEPSAQRGALTLRESSDTVVVLGDLAPAVAFLQVLRGGTRLTASAAGV